MTTVDSFMSTAWRYTKSMPGFIFGTESDLMGETLRQSYKAQGFKNFGTQLNDAFISGMNHHEAEVAANKGFFKKMWKDLTSILPETKDSWKQVGEAADAAKKVGLPKLWSQLKGVGKVLGKRMPLLGALSVLAFELPNILKTTWNEGLLAGGAEAAKTGIRLGIGAVGGAIGTALIPVPILGSIVGYAVGDIVGRFVVGKSYTEKQEALANSKSQNTFKFDSSQFGGNPISDEEFQKMQNEYMQYAQAQTFNNNWNV